MKNNPLSLHVRQIVRAPVESVFDAWTQPSHLLKWWGPKDVTCIDASVDLQVGGRYRLGNRFPDGSVIWIAGEYLEIARPHRLVFSWSIEGGARHDERVTVEFRRLSDDDATEVTVLHEEISDNAVRDSHEAGWIGCLDGLTQHLEPSGDG